MSFQKISTTSKRHSALLFVNYKPAEIRKGQRLQIVYHYKHPLTNEWLRVRLSVPKSKKKSEQMIVAHGMAQKINQKLREGWLPIYDNKDSSEFKLFSYCSDLFLEQGEKDVAKNIKRIDTLRAYKSHFSMLNKFIIKHNFMMFEFKKEFIISFLDWIFYDRNNSARTYNNHLAFLNTFLNYCLERGYIKQNNSIGIKKKPKEPKKRKAFTNEVKEIVNSLQDSNKEFYCLCMATYYCFIRRTELTKIKVKDVLLKANTIVLPAAITKNKKEGIVTIPRAFAPLLAAHLSKANNNDYLFSANGFKSGKKQLAPKRISDVWSIFQKNNRIGREFQFYSLKDTGITDLLISGIPAVKVRDQARHYDLSITESYIARSTRADEIVLNSDFIF